MIFLTWGVDCVRIWCHMYIMTRQRKRIIATLDPELIAWLDTWRDRQPVRTSRSACLDEAIRAFREREERHVSEPTQRD